MNSRKSKGIALFVMLLLCIAGFSVWKYFNTGDAALEQAYTEQKLLYDKISPDDEASAYSQLENDEYANSNDINFLEDAQAVNSDLVGWIEIPDTPIDFPIVQTVDNDYYLTHDFEKQNSDLGVPFLDYRNSSDFSDFNSIVYGHNMEDDMMFRCVNYFQQQEYFDAHQTGTLTLKDKVYTISFFCCANVSSDSELYQEICMTNPQKISFLETLSKYAVCTRESDAWELSDQKLLILSTCTYADGEERTIIVGSLQDK